LDDRVVSLLLIPWIALAPAAPRVAGVDCAEAARVEVAVPGGYDGVRVVSAPGAYGARTVVTVADRERWLSLSAHAGVATALTSATSHADRVTLAIEPDLDAAAGACVVAVEFLRSGEIVATATIE
jgi:hypothetical protein